MPGQQFGDLRHLPVKAGRVAIHLDDKRRFGFHRQPALHKGFDHAHHLPVHHLQRSRHEPGGDDGGDGGAGRLR